MHTIVETVTEHFLGDYEYKIWDNEPEDKFEMARMAYGLPSRVDRIKALGNAVVPLQAKRAFEILSGLKN